jgi:hypothetical protein
MTPWEWFQQNTYVIIGALFGFYLLMARRFPSVTSWQEFLNSFESKGGQLILLWVTDLIVMTILVRYWKFFDAQLQTTIVGLLSGVNGAFLGAIGARSTSNGNGNGSPPPKLDVTFVPGTDPTEKKP